MGGEDSPVSVTGLTLEADSAGAKVSTDTGVKELSLYFVWAFYFWDVLKTTSSPSENLYSRVTD